MNISFFIANKIAFNQKKSFSSFIIKIAIAAIALSSSVMIIGTAITKGYQQVITEKFYDSWGHIHITNFLEDPNLLQNDEKMPIDSTLISRLKKIPEVASLHTYNIQSCLLKTNDDMEGTLLKGLDGPTDPLLSNAYLRNGRKIDFVSAKKNEEIVISKLIADKLNLQVNDQVILYFINKNEYLPRARKVNIVGIYSTGLEDQDAHFVLCDRQLINKVNNDSSNTIQGYALYLHDHRDNVSIEKKIFDELIEAPLQTYTIEKRFSAIFSWLGMMKMNERIIIIIMLVIAVINMITALLILIMERTQMVGILKSLGMNNGTIKQIFLYSSSYIISLGLLIGTSCGVGLCYLQSRFKFIPLDESIYYVKTVPVFIDPVTVVSIVFGTMAVCLSLLLIPAYIVQTIVPTKALKFN